MTLFKLNVNCYPQAAANRIAALTCVWLTQLVCCNQPDESILDPVLLQTMLSGGCYCLLTFACDSLIQACLV